MDNILAQPAKDLDNETDQVIQDCLNNSVVVRKIFQHFSSTELLELSLVTKMWNREARNEMRKRGNLTARVRSNEDQPCLGNVEAFLSVIRHMDSVPFFEISIEITPWGHSCSNLALDPTHDVRLDQLALKKASIEVFGNWLEFQDCPRLLLAKKILQNSSGVLEELSLAIDTDRDQFMEEVVQECSFPRLRVLELREGYFISEEAYMNYMKGLIARAPRLQELQTNGSIDSMLKALQLQGSSAVIRYQHVLRAPFNEISEKVTGALRLEKMGLFYDGFCREFNYERFNTITPLLLEKSCTTTLRSMFINSVLAVPLMCYRVSLEKVEDLAFYINYRHLEQYEPWILRILKEFDFTRTFPNLSKVQIYGDFDYEISADLRNRIIAQANAILREPRPDRAENVKEAHFDGQSNLSNATAHYFAEMLPNIEKLELVATWDKEIPFKSIWKHWVDLKELKIQGDMTGTTGNLDSVFCGIFPEEVAELSLKSAEYLKTVNIVPVMPAITCLRNLKALNLSHVDYRYDAFADGATFMFSKVTALIAFARCPALVVSLNISSFVVPPAMTHLEPYVSVKSTLIKQ